MSTLNDSIREATGARRRSSWLGALLACTVVAFFCRPVDAQTQRISFSFEQPAWTGAPGEVVDDSPFGFDGVAVGGATTANATPVVLTDPGTCRYGVFDGANGYVEVADNAALDIAAELTVAAWIYLGFDALGVAHDRVEGHELRVPHRQSTPRVLVVERQQQHHALDHVDDAARAEPVVSRRHHI